jgi:hypothetical protein
MTRKSMASPRRRQPAQTLQAVRTRLREQFLPAIQGMGESLKAHPRWGMAAGALLLAACC